MPLVPHPVAVLDLETTGLGASDRVIEIGVVLLDRDLHHESTWETLVQPERDIANGHIHGITATDLVHAPRFREIAAELVGLLDGRVVVAHNAAFDTRFLHTEFARLGVDLPTEGPTGWSACTRLLSKDHLPGSPQRLSDCLQTLGLDNARPHAASADAAATADLYRQLLTGHGATQQGTVPFSAPELPDLPRAATCPRGGRPAPPKHWLERVSANVPRTGVEEVDRYRQLLRGALLDGHLSHSEIEQLVATADELGMHREEVHDIHVDYLRQLAVEAWSDGVVTDEERTHLHTIAQQLAVDPAAVDDLLAEPLFGDVEYAGLNPGDRVCFTGALALDRNTWEQRSRAVGLTVGGVTRSTVVVVAANPDTMSGKARHARKYGVPIIDEATFARMLREMIPLDPEETGTGEETGEETTPDFLRIFPWLAALGATPATADDVARAWLDRHRMSPMREMSPRLDPGEVPESMPRTGAVVARWLMQHPRPLDASVTQLSDIPGFGRLRIHRTVMAVVHAALDAPEPTPAAYLVDYGGAGDDLYGHESDVPAGTPAAHVETVAEWLALTGELSRFLDLTDLNGAETPPVVRHALEALSRDTYWGDPAGAAIRRAGDVLSDRIGEDVRDRDIMDNRILGEDTLEQIGDRHEVTRERIRQLESQLKRRLTEPDETVHLVLDALTRRYGVLAPVAQLTADLPALGEEGPAEGHTMLALLDWLSDDWEVSGGWFRTLSFEEDLARALEDFADGYGVVVLPRLADHLGVSAEILRDRLSETHLLLDDHVLTRARSVQDRAAAVLALEGEPLLLPEIAERLPGTHLRTLGNGLAADPRFTRIGRERWALTEWGMEEYSSLADWLSRRVGEEPVPLADLLAEAVGLGVAESSVRAYASTAEFQTVDGLVSRVEDVQEVDVDPDETPHLYRHGDDLRLLTTVTHDHLRGSGSGVPRGVAAALGVPMLGKRTLHSPLGEQTVGMGRTGATVSTIRRFLEAAGIGEGERIWLLFNADGGFDVQRATRRREDLEGVADVLNLTGLDSWISPASGDPLQRINEAVGLRADAPRRRTVSRFRYRRQDDIADRIADL